MNPGDRDATAETLAAPGATAPKPELARVDKHAYDVGDELARGGLGRILQAVDRRLDRPVAIKELLHDDPDHAARFAREALLTARLQHPAIVPVYEAGVWPDGSPFFAMKLVSGKSLEAAVRDRETLSERLALLPHVIHVVEALAYAHDRKIIHRDLKPANVLVGAFGETVVIDWGLAKDLSRAVPDLPVSAPATGGSGGGHTEAGSVMGTPAYMPPEQAMGHAVDTRADVYALGALLYHVVSGAPPYTGTSSREILSAVVRESPEPLEVKEPEAPRELCAIARRAMARDPDERYPTAGELAEDLLRFQRGLRVSAHDYSTVALVTRWAKRHRAALSVAVAMLAVLVVVVIVDVQRIVAERDRARAERAEAQRLRVQADTRGDELALREAEALLARDPRASIEWLLRLTPDSAAYGAARIVAADALGRGLPRAVVPDVQAGALAATPDGALIAAARADDVLVIDVATLERVTVRGRGGEERALAFSPGGGKLAFAGAGGGARLWDRAVRATTELTGGDAEVTALAFAGDAWLIAGDRRGGVHVWDVGRSPSARSSPVGHTGPILSVDAHGARAATGGADGVVRLWEVAGPTLVATLPHGAPVTHVRFTADGKLVTAAADRRARLWDAGGGFVNVLGDHDAEPTALASGEGDLVASGDARGNVYLWAGAPARLATHQDEVRALLFVPGGLVSAARDGTIRVLDLGSRRSRTLVGHEGGVVALARARDRVVSAARDGTLRFWELASDRVRVAAGAGRARVLAAAGARVATGAEGGELVLWENGAPRPLGTAPGPVRALAFAPDGATLAAGTADGTVRVVPLGEGATTTTARLSGPVVALTFDLHGRLLAAGGTGGLRVLEAPGGKERISDAEPVAALAFSPGGTLLAAAGAEVRLWEVDRARPPSVLDGPGAPFSSVACSARHVAAGHERGVTLWRVASREPTPLAGPEGPFVELAFTPDGNTVIGRGARGVRAWDVATGAGRALAGPGASPRALALSSDGRSVAAALVDGNTRVWDLASGRGRTLAGHLGEATGVAFVPGAVATTGLDGTLRLSPDDLPHDPSALRAALEATLR